MAATKLRIYQDALRLLADARLSFITDDVESRYALDDAWNGGVVPFVLRQADWRFALVTAGLSAGGVPAPGYSNSFAQPADWLRTHAIYTVGADGREYPVDIRDATTTVSANAGALLMRYVSNVYSDPELAGHPWPEHFAQAVTAYLAFSIAERVTGERGAAGRMSQLFNQMLGEAIQIDAEPPDRWLPHQRTGAMLRAARELLGAGFWRFAMPIPIAPVAAGSPAAGFTTAYQIPADHVRTHAIWRPAGPGREAPVDVREQSGTWSANVADLRVRYVSTVRGLDPTNWPESFMAALLALLEDGQSRGDEKQASRYSEALVAALASESEPPSEWLPFQLNGEMLRAALQVLGTGFWRFALKTVSSTPGGSPEAGYSNSFLIPGDNVNTHAIFGADYPIDVREAESVWSANVDGFVIRYVSTTLGLDTTLWPMPFESVVKALLLRPSRPPNDRSYDEALAAALAPNSGVAERPDDLLAYQLNKMLLRAARKVLSDGLWRFAMVTEAAIPGGAPAPGYTNAFAIPETHINTCALYVAAAGRESPFDVREQAGVWSANIAGFVARYVSSVRGENATLWPSPFKTAVLALLRDWDATGTERKQEYPEAIVTALASESESPNEWLPYQLDGRFEAAKHVVLREGNWVFHDATGVLRGLKEVQYSALDDQSEDAPSYPFPYRYPLPADHFKTHALFIPWDGQECPINIRETAHDWSTDAGSFVARYLGTEILDAGIWPEPIAAAVLAHLNWRAAPDTQRQAREAEYRRKLADALERHSRPDDEWLPHQLSGAYVAGLKEELEKGRWRFAIKTVSLVDTTDPLPSEEAEGAASIPYAYRFIPANDTLRVVRVYRSLGAGAHAARDDIDYRDEQGALHANFTPITVRYVSRMGLDSTKWTPSFRDALLAWLQYREARGDPAKTAIARVKLEVYEKACREAQRLDDARDRPAIIRSRFTAARYGGDDYARKQGLYPR